MPYKIKLTEEFIEEINDICSYITNILKEPKASNKLRIEVNNFIILYTIEEKQKIVYIVHIYYEKRNYLG